MVDLWLVQGLLLVSFWLDLVLQNKKERLTKKLAFTKPIFLNASQVPCQTTVLELFYEKKILAFTRKRIFAIKLHHWCLIKSFVYSIPLVFIEVFTSLGKHCCGTWKKVYLALYPFEIFYNRLRPNRLFKLLEGFVPNKLLKNFPQERIKFLTE